jgi:WD repeat-containing protein 26
VLLPQTLRTDIGGIRRTALERGVPESGPEVIAEPRRLRRRRRERSSDTEEQPEPEDSSSYPGDISQAETEHRRKRRRGDPMMRLEGEGSNSNGATRPFSNGSGASPLHRAAMPTNGAQKGLTAMNGSSHANGHSHQRAKPRPTYFGHDREEVTRILIQALSDLGYNGAAGTLSQESGYELESPSVAAFRNAVMQGEWAEAEELLFGSTVPSTAEGGVSLNATGLELAEGADKDVMRFWLRQQKFLELLEERDTGRALMVLRTELTPLYQDVGKLHFLSR